MYARERGSHRGLDRGIAGHGAAFVHHGRRRARDRAAVAAGSVRLRHADVLGRKDRPLDDRARAPIERDVDAAERAAERVRLHDRDPLDLVRDGLMRVTGRNHVDEPARQAPRELEDLGVRVARGQIARSGEVGARAARVRGNDHDLGAACAKRRGFGRDRFRQCRDVQAVHVCA